MDLFSDITSFSSSQSSMTATPRQFQINSKSIFLTVPQCDYPLSDFRSNIVAFFRSRSNAIVHGVVAQECHQDGNFHLHAAFTLAGPLRSTDPRIFDALAGKHPNVQSRFKGGVKKAYEYVMKEGNFLPLPDETFSLTDFLSTKKKDSISERVARELRNGVSLDELDELVPAYMLQNLRKVGDYSNFLGLKKRRSEFAMGLVQKVSVVPAPGFFSDWNIQIASWISRNIRVARPHRQAQIWIKAPPGSGKTSLILWLEKTFNLSIYFWPRDEKWWDGYADGAFGLIVLDEYRSQKMITELNPVLSGDPTPLSRRNAAPLVKRDILPVMILSNFSPEECYHKAQPSQLAPLLDRLEIVTVPYGEVIRIAEDTPPEVHPHVRLYPAPPVMSDDVVSFGDLDIPTEEELDALRAPFSFEEETLSDDE